MHAVATAGGGSWECAPGHFRTSPSTTLAGEPTCRPCSPLTDGCALGWQQVPCTPLQDTTCAPCPPPNTATTGRVYVVGGDCLTTACIDGWVVASSSSSSCAPCPHGFHCARGMARACGGNCTTPALGASHPLQCVDVTAATWLGFSIQFTFAAPVFGALPPDGRCPDLDAAVSLWLIHGAFQGCAVALLSDTLGTLTCTVTTPRCIAGDFLAWLMPTVAAGGTPPHLADCLTTPSSTLVVGAPLIQEAPLRPPAPPRQSLRPIDAPRLQIERRHWGQSRLDGLTTLATVCAVVGGLGVGAASACALACTRAHRRRLTRRVFARLEHHRLLLLRRLWLKKKPDGAAVVSSVATPPPLLLPLSRPKPPAPALWTKAATIAAVRTLPPPLA
jgi:hypothetical protein